MEARITKKKRVNGPPDSLLLTGIHRRQAKLPELQKKWNDLPSETTVRTAPVDDNQSQRSSKTDKTDRTSKTERTESNVSSQVPLDKKIHYHYHEPPKKQYKAFQKNRDRPVYTAPGMETYMGI